MAIIPHPERVGIFRGIMLFTKRHVMSETSGSWPGGASPSQSMVTPFSRSVISGAKLPPVTSQEKDSSSHPSGTCSVIVTSSPNSIWLNIPALLSLDVKFPGPGEGLRTETPCPNRVMQNFLR